MRKEPLVGAGVGAVVVGYFTSTEPNLFTSLLLGAVFLALSVQLAVIAVEERGARPSPRLLAYAVTGITAAQTVISFWMLLVAQHTFSLVGVLCGLCFITVGRAALQRQARVQAS